MKMDSIRNAMKRIIEKCDVCIDGNVISRELLIKTFSGFISSTMNKKKPSEIHDFRGLLVRVVRLERTVSWSQTFE